LVGAFAAAALLASLGACGETAPQDAQQAKQVTMRNKHHEDLKALWTARCDDNSQWAIFIAVNGDVQVRNCEEMQQLGLPACQALPPAPGGGDSKAPARR
jgi:hypothetical protein